MLVMSGIPLGILAWLWGCHSALGSDATWVQPHSEYQLQWGLNEVTTQAGVAAMAQHGASSCHSKTTFLEMSAVAMGHAHRLARDRQRCRCLPLPN